MVSNILYFHPYLGKIPILTNIFQMGWFNHQPDLFLALLDGLFFWGYKQPLDEQCLHSIWGSSRSQRDPIYSGSRLQSEVEKLNRVTEHWVDGIETRKLSCN